MTTRSIHLVWFDRIQIKLLLILPRIFYKLTIVFKVSRIIFFRREYSIVRSCYNLQEDCKNILHLDEFQQNTLFFMNYAKQWDFIQLYTNLSLRTIHLNCYRIGSQIDDFAQTKAMFVVGDPDFFPTVHGVLKPSKTGKHTKILNRKYSISTKVAYRQPKRLYFLPGRFCGHVENQMTS